MSHSTPLISWTDSGLHCSAGGFHIDPHRPVKLALVTHAHSDHARRGSEKYITPASGVGLLRVRLGKSIRVQGVNYGEKFRLGDVWVSFHPAGHILGSSQIRVEHDGDIWVATGDYKRDPDPSCEPFESVQCDTLITEATFGTPKYCWDKRVDHGQQMAEWWYANAQTGLNSIIYGYSLGKTQRILTLLRGYAKKPILIHKSMLELTECYRDHGISMADYRLLPDLTQAPGLFQDPPLEGELILAPPSWLRDNPQVVERLGQYRTAFASGWMMGQSAGRHGTDHGFLLSDHADWNDLNRTIQESGASRVFVQHRSNGALVRHLRRLGLEAHSSEELTLDRFSRLPTRNLELFPRSP